MQQPIGRTCDMINSLSKEVLDNRIWVRKKWKRQITFITSILSFTTEYVHTLVQRNVMFEYDPHIYVGQHCMRRIEFKKSTMSIYTITTANRFRYVLNGVLGRNLLIIGCMEQCNTDSNKQIIETERYRTWKGQHSPCTNDLHSNLIDKWTRIIT